VITVEDWFSPTTVSTVCQWLVAALLVIALLVRYRSFAKDLYWFAVSQVGLLALIGLVYALAFGQIGTGLGINYLFWHEDFPTRVSASLGVTLFLGLVGSIAYYLDPLPWRTDQKTRAWMAPDELIKRAITRFWWRLIGRPAPEHPHELPEGPPPGMNDKVVFVLSTLIDPIAVTPLQWVLEPRRENQVRLQRFLRTCRTPFLLLLLAPAFLPGVFTQIPRVAPTGALGWPDPPPIWDVSRFHEGGNFLKGYGLSVASWLLGVILGVTAVKLLIRLSELLPRAQTRAEPLTDRGEHPEWVRADVDCPLFGQGRVCPGGDCPRGARVSGVGPPSKCRAQRMMRDSVLVLILFFLLTYVALRVFEPLNEFVSPAFAICALLGILAMLYTVVAQFRPLTRPLVILGLIAWICIANNRPFKLKFERMKAEYADPIDLRTRVDQSYFRKADATTIKNLDLVPDGVALDHWLAFADPKIDQDIVDNRPKLVIVSVSGGAARSALWTAVVLDRLEHEFPEFGRRVRIITGASGGMLGTAYYVRHRLDLAPSGSEVRKSVAAHLKPQPPARADWVEAVPHNGMEPLAKYIALREVWQSLYPGSQAEDRGIALERDWAEIRFPLRLLAPVEKLGEVPSLIFSPMMIEDGRQLLISNLDLYRDASGEVLQRPIPKTLGRDVSYDSVASDLQSVSLPGLEFYRIFPDAKGFLLSTAVRMNASFPYVSPAVNLPTQPPRRVVDAGYYDNYGIQVAAAWLEQNRQWCAQHTSGVLWVQIRDSSGERDRLDIKDERPGNWALAMRGFQFFTSPLDAVVEARYTSAAFRNDTDVAGPNEQFQESMQRLLADSGQFCTTVIFENSADVSIGDEDVWSELGRLYEESFVPGIVTRPSSRHEGVREVAMTWYLTRAERRATRGGIPGNPPANSPLADPTKRLALMRVLKGQVFGTLEPEECDRLAREYGERVLRATNKLDTISTAKLAEMIQKAGLRELRRQGILSFPPGPERNVRLKRLEQLRNYERIDNLRIWWNQAGKRK
jgi:hypothetical protein